MPKYSSSVTEIGEIAPGVVQLTISVHGSGFHFQPGQYINLNSFEDAIVETFGALP